MRQQGVEQALDTRAARQAEEGAVGADALFTNAVRSTSSTSGEFTVDTRAVRQAAVGIEGDLFVESDTGLIYYADSPTSWKYFSGIAYGTNAARAGLTITTDDDGAWFFVTDAGTNYGLWRVVAGAWVKELLPASPDVATSYKVNGNQVVGARKTGWGSPSGTLSRAAYAGTIAAALPVGAAYTQGEVEALRDEVVKLSQGLAALLTDFHSATSGHGSIGT